MTNSARTTGAIVALVLACSLVACRGGDDRETISQERCRAIQQDPGCCQDASSESTYYVLDEKCDSGDVRVMFG